MNPDAQGYTGLGGALAAAPAVTAIPSSSGGLQAPLYIGVGTDHNVYLRNNSAGWHALSSTPLSCLDSVGATVTGAAGNSMLTVACEGSDQALWYAQGAVTTTGLPNLSSWQSLGGVLTAGPAVAAVGGAVTFFVDAGGGALFSRNVSTGWVALSAPARSILRRGRSAPRRTRRATATMTPDDTRSTPGRGGERSSVPVVRSSTARRSR